MNGYELKMVRSAKYLEPRHSVGPTAYKPDYAGTANLAATPLKSEGHAKQMLQTRFFYLLSRMS